MAALFHSRSIRIACLGLLSAHAILAQESPTTENDEGLLELNSGDFLRGTVESLDNEGKLTWKHSLTGQNIRYHTKGVRRILFKRGTSPNEGSDVLWLSSGDRFVCRVQSITENEVVVVSSVLDAPLRFKRSEVTGVTLRDSASHDEAILGGAMEETDWDVPNFRSDSSKVTFKDGKMIIEGSFWAGITREAEFPESFLIDMKIDWKDTLGMRFELGGADDDDVAKVSLVLEIQNDSIRMQRVIISDNAKRKSYSTLANVRDIDALADGARSMHLQAYVNTLSGDCSIYINSKFAGKSEAPLISESLNETHIFGSGIQIYQKSPSPVRIRSLAIHQWDGRSLPSQPQIRRTDTDHIYFEDGDNTKGKIITLKGSGDERILTAEIPYSEKSTVNIPAPFLDYFTFANENPSNPASEFTIRVFLTDGSILHLNRLESRPESSLEGELIGGYKINIPTESVARILFKSTESEETEDE